MSVLRALLALAVLFAASSTDAADPNKPHRHQGVLLPFTGPPPPPALSESEWKKIRSGGVVLRKMDQRGDGRREVVFQVEAPAEVVWALVSDFQAFPTYLEEIKRVDILRSEGDVTDVKFTVGQMGVTLEYFVRHTYKNAERWGTWTLDYAKESDLDDSIGFWRVTPLDGNPTVSLVEYSADVRLQSWMPDFLRDIVVDKGMDATPGWVRAHAKKKLAALPPVRAP